MTDIGHDSASLLEFDGVTKAFGKVQVLHGVSFTLAAGEVLALVGENGSGKSTTMNILGGVCQHDGGCMRLRGSPFAPASRAQSERAGIAFIQQELNIFPNLSVADNLLLGRAPRWAKGLPLLDRRSAFRTSRMWLERVGLAVDPAMPASKLSAGERQLLEIARALACEAQIIIFDEPTTSLSARETERLFALIGALKEQGIGILFISHALEDVLALADRIVVLRDGRTTLEVQSAQTSIDQLVQAMVGRPITALFPSRPHREPEPEPILSVEGVGEPGLLDDISLSVGAHEIVGICGLMGAGRSELARILFGIDPHRTGRIVLDGTELASGDIGARLRAGMAFLSEDRRHEGLLREASVADNIALAALPHFAGPVAMIDRGGLKAAVRRLAEAVRLKSGDVDHTAIGTLSGGNQQKALLGRWMLRSPRLFILDEPTRGVDIGAKQEIYRLLVEMAEQGAGLILISSEIEELMGLADRVLVLHRGRVSAELAIGQCSRERLLSAAFGQGAAA